MNEKVLMTAGRARETVPGSGKGGGFVSLHQLEKGKLKLDDQAYCVRFGTPAHFAGLRKLIEADRDKLPAYSYWRCENPHCFWKDKKDGEAKEPVRCLRCNMAGYRDGSWMKKMTNVEAAEFEQAEATRAIRETEQLTLMEFNRRNDNRTREGLPVLTRAEFDKQQQAEFQLEQERRRHLTKSFYDRKKAQELKEAEELKAKP